MIHLIHGNVNLKRKIKHNRSKITKMDNIENDFTILYFPLFLLFYYFTMLYLSHALMIMFNS